MGKKTTLNSNINYSLQKKIQAKLLPNSIFWCTKAPKIIKVTKASKQTIVLDKSIIFFSIFRAFEAKKST